MTSRSTRSRIAASRGGSFTALHGAVFVAVFALSGATGRLAAQNQSEPCITCHLEHEDERLRAPAVAFSNDVHAEQGFGCLACHGTLREGSPDAAAGFLTAPERREVPGVCASCHSDVLFMRDYNPNIRVDQLSEYVTSIHGQKLMDLDDPDVATCTSCHPSHGIRPPSDVESIVHPLNVADLCASCHEDADMMGARGHQTGQLEDYVAGVHGQLMYEGGDMSAPTCNDCHGNHGAAPPGVGAVQNVCGQCHVGMAEFFEQSGHVEWFSERGLPGCATCHDNHLVVEPDDSFLAEVSRDVCGSCHTEDDPYGAEFDEILEMLQSLEEDVAHARSSLDEAEDMGMEVSQALFELEDVNNALTLARTAAHSFMTDPVLLEIENGRAVAETASERAESAFGEHRFRRVGLAVTAGLVTILILGLWLRIRRFDLRLRRNSEAMRLFYQTHMDAGGPYPLTSAQARLAGTTVLLELAQADVYDDAKRQFLEHFVRRYLGPDAPADEVIALAERQRVESMDIGRLSYLMARRYTPAQKAEAAEAIWELVLSEPELARLQGRFLHRIPQLLDISQDELESALERVQNRVVTG